MLKNSVKEQLSEMPENVDVVLIKTDVSVILLSNVEVGELISPEFCESSKTEEFPLMSPVSRSRFKSTAYLLATRLRSLAEPDERTGLLIFGSIPVELIGL